MVEKPSFLEKLGFFAQFINLFRKNEFNRR